MTEKTEEYTQRFEASNLCQNPKNDTLIFGYTFWRNRSLNDKELKKLINNAKNNFNRCPPCTLNCQLRNMAQSNVTQLRQLLLTPELTG